MTIDVLAPSAPNDPVARLGSEIARLNAERLRAAGHEVTECIGPRCTASLLAAQARGDGVAYFGHGLGDMLPGSDEQPILRAPDELQGRWAHLMACDSEGEARRLVKAGATAVAGYRRSLAYRWDLHDVEPAIEPAFQRQVTAVTVAMAGGVLDLNGLQLGLVADVEEIVDWVKRRGSSLGLATFATDLMQGLTVELGRDSAVT